VPLYGATLVGEVQVIDGEDKGCKPFPSKLAPGPSGLPVVALVDRGDCYFIEKAFNAEKAGAAAIIVADYKDERLLTMAAPDDRPEIARLKEEISIPTALVTMAVGAKLRKAAARSGSKGGSGVVVELDWKDAVTNPDDRVEWELCVFVFFGFLVFSFFSRPATLHPFSFSLSHHPPTPPPKKHPLYSWTSPDTGCGPSCDRQAAFKSSIKTQAAALERGKYTAFTPRFVTRRCADGTPRSECEDACIHKGRYCAWAPVADKFKSSFKGRDVVTEAKRQLCAHEAATSAGKPWAWWDYATAVGDACTMANGKFGSASCAAGPLKDAGIDPAVVEACVGDVDADADPAILAANAEAQGYTNGGGGASKVLLLPTVTINGAQYRGRLDPPSVLRGLCAGFSELAEPAECLAGGLEANECEAADHGGCWANDEFSACVDTFRGRKCQCPYGFKGDGFTCTDVRSGVDAAGVGGGGKASLGAGAFAGVMASAAGIAALAGLVAHRLKARAELQAEVQAILREYVPLEGGVDGGFSPMASSGGGGSARASSGSGAGGGGGFGFGGGAAAAAPPAYDAVMPAPDDARAPLNDQV
jgi:hypothetical protein